MQNHRPRLPHLLLTTAIGASLAGAGPPMQAQDRPLTADFPEVYRVGGLDAEDWARSLIGVLQRPHEPEPVDSRIRSRTIEQALHEFERLFNDADAEALAQAPSLPDAYREGLENRQFFDEVPVVRGLRAGWNGALWVQRRSDEPWDDGGPIDVFGPDREYLGTFPAGATEMPAAFGPDGLAAFWETDEFDVPSIVVRRLPEALR